MRKRRLFLLLLSIAIICLIFWHTPLARAGTYADKVLSYNPVAYWPLNETTGAIAYDLGSGDHDCTYTGVTLDQIDGPGTTMGRAGLWDGVNDYIDIGATAGYLTNTAFTVAIWVSSLSLSPGDHFAFDRANRLTIGTHIVSNIMHFGSAYNTTWIYNAASMLYSWHMLLMTYDGAGTAKFYQDGAYITELGSLANLGSATQSTIGTRYSVTAAFWYGYIQHVMIFTSALGTDAITDLSDPNPPPTPTPTPTNTPTNTPVPSATFTPRSPQLISTLTNGNEWELDYQITAGDIAQFIPALILISFLIFLVFLKLVKR